MSDFLDVTAQLLNVSGGRLVTDEPLGFLTLSAPRKAARGREKDTLLLCLGLKTRDAAPPERYDELLELAAQTFYGNPGSVTSALRLALAAVNQRLLDSNLAAGQPGGAPPAQGSLTAAVLRGADFYAVQGGQGLLLVARSTGHERFPNTPSRPLGLSNNIDALYFHTSVGPGDYFAFTSLPPRGWTDIALVGLGNLTALEAVAERLRETAGPEATALVGRFDPGAGYSAQPPAPEPVAVNKPANRRAPPERPPVPEPAYTSEPPADSAAEAPAEAPPEPVVQPPAPPARQPRGAGLAEFFKLKPRTTPAPVEAAPVEEAPVETPSPEESGGIPTPAAFWGVGQPAHTPAAVQPDLPHFLENRGPAVPQAELDPSAQPAAGDEPPAGNSRARRRATREAIPEAERKPGLFSPVQRVFRSVGRAVGVTLSEIIRAVRTLLARMLPEGMLQKEGLFVVPTSVQIGLAILIPVLVVGTSVWLYLENGRNEQYKGALSEAQWAIGLGRAATDPPAGRPHWEAALNWAAQAEAIRPGQPEVEALRQEAQAKLDELDWVTRLDFQPLLVSGVGSGSRLTHLVLVGQDVYVLDEGQNKVLRITPNPLGATSTAGGAGLYTVDPAFECAGGQTLSGNVTVGTLIDLALVPGPTVIAGDNTLSGDVLLAMDSLGSIIYCTTDHAPYASYLTAPEIGWARPMAMELYADRLYVLDPGNSEIWQFQASGGAFSTPPARYFTTVSYDLADTTEFSIAGGDIFLLHKDGRIANCTRSGPGAPASCTEVLPFTDGRPGRGIADKLADVTNPLGLTYDAPPEPSLYLLDGQSSGVYQLSLKLDLVKQFRPYFPLAGPISAIGVDPAKRLFAAAGDNVYVATRP